MITFLCLVRIQIDLMETEEMKGQGRTRKDRDKKKGEKSRYGKEDECRIWKLKQQEKIGKSKPKRQQ